MTKLEGERPKPIGELLPGAYDSEFTKKFGEPDEQRRQEATEVLEEINLTGRSVELGSEIENFIFLLRGEEKGLRKQEESELRETFSQLVWEKEWELRCALGENVREVLEAWEATANLREQSK